MYTKVDSTMTIGDLIAGTDYRVVVYCGYDSASIRSPEPDVDGVSGSPYTSNYLTTDGQLEKLATVSLSIDDVEKDIPKATENKIGSVMGWFKVEDGKIVSEDKTYDESESVLFYAEPFEKELVVVVD